MTAADTPTAPSEPAEPSEFTVGYVPGVMPGKWFGRWRERRMRPELRDILVPAADWRSALDDAAVTACFVRLGWAPGDPSLKDLRVAHNAVHLYDELQVAVLSTDDVLTVLDSLTLAQLTEESAPQPPADIDDAAMAVELAAAGVGPVVLPMSVARLHARKDVTFRELTDAPTVPVVLVWPRGLDEEDEETVQRFVGIVRGRKESSGRERGGGSQSGPCEDRAGAASSVGERGGAGRTTTRTSGQSGRARVKGAAPAGGASGKRAAARGARAGSPRKASGRGKRR